MLKLKQWQLGYMAGLVDGEFHVGIQQRQEYPRKTPSYAIILALTITDIKIVNFIMSIVPNATLRYRKRISPRHLPVYALWFKLKERVELLEAIIPYLQGKQQQAKICLEMEKLKRKYTPNRSHPNAKHFTRVDPKFLKPAAKLFKEFRKLQLSKRKLAGKPRLNSVNPTSKGKPYIPQRKMH
jgi:hypothetical protein